MQIIKTIKDTAFENVHTDVHFTVKTDAVKAMLKKNIAIRNGQSTVAPPPQSLELGLAAAMEYGEKLASVVSLRQLYSCEGGGAVCYIIPPAYDIICCTFFLYRRSY